jgi:hypothetical protein
MTLKGRLGKAVQRRVEAMPSVQAAMARSERIAPIHQAAHRAAYSALDAEEQRQADTRRIRTDELLGCGHEEDQDQFDPRGKTSAQEHQERGAHRARRTTSWPEGAEGYPWR